MILFTNTNNWNFKDKISVKSLSTYISACSKKCFLRTVPITNSNFVLQDNSKELDNSYQQKQYL